MKGQYNHLLTTLWVSLATPVSIAIASVRLKVSSSVRVAIVAIHTATVSCRQIR